MRLRLKTTKLAVCFMTRVDASLCSALRSQITDKRMNFKQIGDIFLTSMTRIMCKNIKLVN